MGNDFRNDSVPMCRVFLNPILKETQRSSFYRLNKQKQDSQHNAANLVDDIIQNLNFEKSKVSDKNSQSYVYIVDLFIR